MFISRAKSQERPEQSHRRGHQDGHFSPKRDKVQDIVGEAEGTRFFRLEDQRPRRDLIVAYILLTGGYT